MSKRVTCLTATGFPIGALVTQDTPKGRVYRVAVSTQQNIIGFPKLGTTGIAFEHWTDGCLNLPATTPVLEIYQHIKCDKGDSRITASTCLAAIRKIQKAVMGDICAATMQELRSTTDPQTKLDILMRFLRQTEYSDLTEEP